MNIPINKETKSIENNIIFHQDLAGTSLLFRGLTSTLP